MRLQPAEKFETFETSNLGKVVWLCRWTCATVAFLPLFQTFASVFDCTRQSDGTWSWDRDPTVDAAQGEFGEYV